jgi:hypothetical protein
MHEVHGVAFAQRHADLRIVLETADAGTVTAARIDDHVRPAVGVDRDPFRRNDAQERIVDGTRERASVHDRLVVEMKHRRQSLPLVLEEDVAALAQRVPHQDRPLEEVDRVLRGALRELPRHHRTGLGGARCVLEDFSHAAVVTVERQLGARLQQLYDLRRYLVAFGKLLAGIRHGITFYD